MPTATPTPLPPKTPPPPAKPVPNKSPPSGDKQMSQRKLRQTGNAEKARSQSLEILSGVIAKAHKVVVYGPGGVGKTELCANLKTIGIKPLFLDLEEGSQFLDVARIIPLCFDDCRAVLHNREIWESYDAVVVDSLTKADELSVAWTLENITTEKSVHVTSIEGYGWGKGYTHTFETFLQLLSDLDAVVRAGKHVICTAHDCTANVPNPGGDDWCRYEPRLQSPASGKGSIRHRVKEWCDHLLYIGFDQSVTDGKATGNGSRTIYPTEMPTHWAKSRTLADVVDYEKGSAKIWQRLFGV